MRTGKVDPRVADRAEAVAQDQADFLRSLVAARKRHGLSQAQVAERMGVSQPAVAEFERYDVNPTFSTVLRYAVSVDVRTRTRVIDDAVTPTRPTGVFVQLESIPYLNDDGTGMTPVITISSVHPDSLERTGRAPRETVITYQPGKEAVPA
ncbi:MAG: helix-turn-helix domain-containing protein [Propionibacteriaceae bacterium]|jgi:transcriptional regulator with XRE-family HTH domain|nr:helix-turn-helix domain-containing protein [Propionibacteriaceae bacterium]